MRNQVRLPTTALVLALLVALGWPLASGIVQTGSLAFQRLLTGFQTDWRFLQLSWQHHPPTGIPGWEAGLHGPLVALILVAGYGVWRCVKYHHL